MRCLFDGASVRVFSSGGYREVVLSRPERHNALDAGMREELHQVLGALELDDAGGIGLRGEGPSFCSGGDLSEFGRRDPAEGHAIRMARSLPQLFARLCSRLVVAIHGHCVGAGLELAAFARVVLAADDARLWLPEVSMGLIPGSGGTVSVPARIGRGPALELMVSGRALDAEEARRAGLVDRVLAPEELLGALREEAGAR
jgi:enoyl-CoA hydratase/carnithine racemase